MDRQNLPVLVDQQSVVVDLEFLVFDALGESLGVRTGVEAEPAMRVDVVEPQIVHGMAIRLDEAVDAFAEEECAAQVGSVDQRFRAPGPAARQTPFRIGGGNAQIQPLVVVQRLDLVEVRARLGGEHGQRSLTLDLLGLVTPHGGAPHGHASQAQNHDEHSHSWNYHMASPIKGVLGYESGETQTYQSPTGDRLPPWPGCGTVCRSSRRYTCRPPRRSRYSGSIRPRFPGH